MLHHRCVTAQPSTQPRAPRSEGTRRRGQMLRSGDSRRKRGILRRSGRTRIGPSVQRVTSHILPNTKSHQELYLVRRRGAGVSVVIWSISGLGLTASRQAEYLCRQVPARRPDAPPTGAPGTVYLVRSLQEYPGGRTQSYSEKRASRSTARASDGDAFAARPVSQWSRTNRHHWSL